MGDSDSLTVWTYDIRGRVSTEAKEVDSILYPSTVYTYNLADLPSTLTYPYGETVTTRYTDRMLVDKLVNENGTPNDPADDYYYMNSTIYDSASRMTSRSLGNGLTQSYTFYNWDASAQGGRLHYLTTGTLQNFTYTYDAVGNILSIVDSAAGSQTQNFEYDDLDRLWHASATGTEAQGGYAQETYDYDTLTGNLQLKGDLTLHYDDASHAHAATSATKEGVTNTYTYDANGNMETRVANGQSFEFDYDAENRLVSVTGVNGTTLSASFDYDADGARIRSVMDGETIVFIGSHCEIANPGQTQIVIRYYLTGGARVAMRKGETLSYLLADHISSTSLTTNESGLRTSELRYKAFGETRFFFGTMPTRYTFTGQYSYTDDPSTQGVTEGFGLMFFNARWMDPYLNRFSQPDSIVPDPYNSQDWDRYSYARSNPLKYVDPDGHNPILIVLAIIGAAIFLSQIPSDQYQADPAHWGDPGIQLLGLGLMLPQLIVGSCVNDGDCTNEATLTEQALESANQDGDPTNEFQSLKKTGETLLDAVSKSDAREALRAGINGLTNGQTGGILKILGKGKMDSITLNTLQNGNVQVVTQVPGGDGSSFVQYIYTLDPSGKVINLIQQGFNAAGEIIHVHDHINDFIIE